MLLSILGISLLARGAFSSAALDDSTAEYVLAEDLVFANGFTPISNLLQGGTTLQRRQQFQCLNPGWGTNTTTRQKSSARIFLGDASRLRLHAATPRTITIQTRRYAVLAEAPVSLAINAVPTTAAQQTAAAVAMGTARLW
ncbi:hypothetical protein FOMA001_g13748 [Fusarium oxysporum f. sp. matthiolae]|nr:hypothetical protein FOMA001_g13748 [Fusarium oxysporum f. sp. matthiolae]